MPISLSLTTVASASRIIFHNLPAPVKTALPLNDAVGQVLAENVIADRDAPPYDRVMMDGIAIRSSSRLEFKLQATQIAGQKPLSLKSSAHCIKVMTGAVLPNGCDRVIPVEQTFTNAYGSLRIKTSSLIHNERFIHTKGTDAKKGAILCHKGTKLLPAHIITAAANGKTKIRVFQRPDIIVVATGDELVDVGRTPSRYQIRGSNAPGIAAALRLFGFNHIIFLQTKDDLPALKKALKKACQIGDVIITIGGVSMGETDLIPQALKTEGANILCHKVKQRPGKPFLFAVRNNEHRPYQNNFIFSLPGNPVSSLVCSYRYMIPFLRRVSGEQSHATNPSQVCLKTSHKKGHVFTDFLPVKITKHGPDVHAQLIKINCSGDHAALIKSDGFIEIPEKKTLIEKDSPVSFYSWTP